MKKNTMQEFDETVSICRNLFLKKMHDYGLSWRILRPSSLTDLIYIKAQRIKSIEEKGCQAVEDDIFSEYVGIINYAVMAQIQLVYGPCSIGDTTLSQQQVSDLYDKYVKNAKNLLANKNHDYDEAWRNMRMTSITDVILMKLLRIKQIEDNHEQSLVSEGLDANFYDIFNYAVFALIRLNEIKNETI